MARKTDAVTHLRRILADWPEAQAEYERLGPRFEAISALIDARKRENLTQAELARRMGVSPAVLSRLESAAHSPRLDTLAEAARAMGHRLEVRFVRESSPRYDSAKPAPRGSRKRRAS